MFRELTCIVCPIGCTISVEHDAGVIKNITGNNCPRGKTYAESELINPVRIVTTTVKCENGELLPVKTASPVPKDKVMEIVKILNNLIIPLPICVGDVIMDNIFGSKILATKNILIKDSVK